MKNLSKILAVLIAAFLIVSCSNAQTEQSGVVTKNVVPKEFKSLIEKSNGNIVDVRTPEEVAEGKIKSAINIDFYGDDFDAEINKLDKTKPVYVYCASGGRSGNAMRKMKNLGFTEIYNLKGGMGAWLGSGFPVE